LRTSPFFWILWVFIAHCFYLLIEGRTKKSSSSIALKHLMCKKENISLTHQRENILWFTMEPDKIVKGTSTCAQCLAEPEGNAFGSSLYLFVWGLITWISPKMLVLIAYQTYLGLNAWLIRRMLSLARRRTHIYLG